MSALQPFTLSVVIPTHGERASVLDAVRALLQEPSDGLEVIVVSDGDPAFAERILSDIDDDRLTLASQAKAGSAAARNLGLSLARHEWVAFVDDDDVPRSTWFSVWADHASDGRMVMTACVKHWQGGDVLKERRCCSLNPDDPTMGASRLLAGAFVSRRTALDVIGGYDLELRASQNHDLGLRLVQHIRDLGITNAVVNTDRVVIDVFTEEADTRKQRYGTARADAGRLFLRRYQARLAVDPNHAAALQRIIARSALDEGDFSAFRRASLAAVRARPLQWRNWRFVLAALIPASWSKSLMEGGRHRGHG